ncbi:hypothetical protein GGI43DRAFT_214386 [Trichoderma evansii]
MLLLVLVCTSCLFSVLPLVAKDEVETGLARAVCFVFQASENNQYYSFPLTRLAHAATHSSDNSRISGENRKLASRENWVVNPPRAHSSLNTAAEKLSKQGDIQWLNSQSLGLGFYVLVLRRATQISKRAGKLCMQPERWRQGFAWR